MQSKIKPFGEKYNIVIPGDYETTIDFCSEYFFSLGNEAIEKRGAFFVALSGGSTPKAMYERLALPENSNRLDWTKVKLFWGDERPVPPTHPDSNYKMAMDAAFSKLPVPEENIFRITAERDMELNASFYEKTIKEYIPSETFDMMILGMGDDGHTASLFPHTSALNIQDKLVVANTIPQKDTCRITLTYPCINNSRNICIFVLGVGKAETLEKVMSLPVQPETYPIQKIGSPSNKALWVLDKDAANLLREDLQM